MENFFIALNCVLPLFLLMLVGYFCRQIHLYGEDALKTMNKLVFKVFLPVLIFNNIRTSSIENLNGNVLIFAAVSLFILFGILFLIIPLIEKNNKRRGVLIQGIGRSNYVLFGIPLATSLCGDTGAGIASLLVTVAIPIFNALSVVALEVYRRDSDDQTEKTSVLKIVKGIVTNPLIIASLLGLVTLLSGIQFPTVIDSVISDLSKIATPLALFLLGGSFKFSAIRKNVGPILFGVISKLLISPLIFVTAAVLLGFRNEELAPLMILFASPTAVNSYTMAQLMGGDDELAGQLVVFSTAFSVLTVFLWIFAFKQLGLI